MMRCRDIAEADADSLSGLRKVLYRFHLSLCPACKANHKQVETTIATLNALPKNAPSEDAREKALAAFRKNKKEHV
jgi:hypothetical protein